LYLKCSFKENVVTPLLGFGKFDAGIDQLQLGLDIESFHFQQKEESFFRDIQERAVSQTTSSLN